MPSIGRVSIYENRAVWEPHSVDALASIRTPRSIYADTDTPGQTTLWIGGTNSILRHVINGKLSAPAPRAPLLRAFAHASEKEGRRPIEGALPYSTRGIEFEFAAPEFSRRASLRLETKIDGIDQDWVPAARDSRRELTALRDGRYTFRVRAVAETGVASEPTVFHFQVLPPWWRTAPAIAGIVFALLPAGYGLYRLRVRRLRLRNAELEEKVRERTEQLEEASAAKTQFVASMSHDIRNPLNGIVGLALALEDSRLDKRQREMVATLRDCTTYLSSLVDDVLDFASIEAGRVELRPGPYSPGELLRSVTTALKADTAERGATITIEADPDLPANLLGDAGRIQQILVNYVSNALKYAGTHIYLSAAIPAHSPGEVEFSVSDEGPGISEDEQKTLFTKFSRLQRTRNDAPGTGLGLASCRLLADIMGGSVGVQSSPGHGARFYLRIPLAIASEPAPVPAAHLPNTTVLVVEDADYNAWAASAVLAKLGLACERARNGEEALRLFAEKRFNVVLLDRNLPDMDGTEVARRMRAMESDGLQAVLLAVTAYCTAEDRALCLESGMDAFVGKPLTPEKLRKVLVAAGRRLLTAASVHVSPETPPVSSAPSAELDMSLLSYLADGNEQGLHDQLQRFLTTLSEAEAHMRETARAQDYEKLATCAHRVLGQARMIGAQALTDAAAKLEAAARADDAAACGEGMQHVTAEIRAVTEAVRRHRPAEQTA